MIDLKLMLTDRQGATREIEGEADMTLMEAIRLSGADELLALCGGGCSCATCHVYIGEGFEDRMPPMSEDEEVLLDNSDHRNAQSRLSCQIPLSSALEGLHATIAPED